MDAHPAPVVPSDSRGAAALRAFGFIEPAVIRDLLATYDPSGSSDRSLSTLADATGGSVDLAIAAHRRALLRLLRAWGCRHLRTADDAMSSRALRNWWSSCRALLPPGDRQIADLGERDLDRAARAYDGLATRRAARRATMDGAEVAVTFAGTAASKALFALRPTVFLPWDEPIRLAFGWRKPTGNHYRAYLRASADALRRSAARSGVTIASLPGTLGRPGSSPAKLVDEFLWLRLTRGR
jgi:hypothetical protein